MPITADLAESNRAQTDRLRRLAKRLTPDMLAVRLPRGWTVAVALAHLAFWDRQRLNVMRRWAAGVPVRGAYDGELFNETLLSVFELIPPDRTPAAALAAAEEVDAFLLRVPDDVIAAALDAPDPPNLDRGSHRDYHLERIEQALSAAGY
jgi:hypothetical protein